MVSMELMQLRYFVTVAQLLEEFWRIGSLTP